MTAVLAPGFLPATLAESDTRPGPVEVPFRLHRDYIIVVKGSVAGLEKRNFLIDTGAVPSLIDARLAKKLKLKGRREALSAFTGTTVGRRVRLPNLELGPIRLTQLDMLTQDLRFIEREIGVRIDAVIGLDVLGRSNLAIDYEHRKNGAAALPEVNLPDLRIGDARLGPRTAVLVPGKSMLKFDGLLGLRSLGASRVYFDFNRQLMSWVGSAESSPAPCVSVGC